MSTSPTTVLEAVNTMLTSIGEAPVNSLTSGLEDAELAESILLNVNREVQSRGWIFNTDLEYLLYPVADGTIYLPDNVIRIDTTDRVRSSKKEIIERGRKMYDRKNNTFNLTEYATGGLKVDVVILVAFTDLPEPARRYIAIRSARIFQDRVLSSRELHGFQEVDEMQALTELKDYEGEQTDYNIFDSYDVYRVVDRDIATDPITTLNY